MTTISNYSRRDFLKSMCLAGGIAALPNLFNMNIAQAQQTAKYSPLLKDVCDIHIHAAPDVKERLIDELSFAHQAKQAGYRCIMYKSNEWSCHDRVYLLRKIIPDFEIFGSLCMNYTHGDKVNAYAARMAVETTGDFCRCIYMPTQVARYQKIYEKSPQKGIPVLSDTNKVLPEVVKVMEICAKANIIFATGHCSPQENIILAKKAREVGVEKFVVTHANSHIWKMTHDQIKEIIELGGWIEYSFITNLWGPGTGVPMNKRMSSEEFVSYTQIAPERSFISTDLGQVNMPNPIDGMLMCIQELQKAGVPQKDIDIMTKTNPARLMNLS